MRAALYARISEDRTGEARGVGDQLTDTRRLAEARGWDVVGEYPDNDLSAAAGGPRPGYEALLGHVRAGLVDRIVVWHTSRLWRNRRERAEGIEILKHARVSVVAVKGPELDMTTAYGRGVAGLIGEFDTMESEVKSERVSRAALRRAVAGRNHGGRRCWGYTADGMHMVPAEAAEIARLASELLAGVPLSALTRGLNARGVGTVGGKRWDPPTLRDLLMRPRLAGLSVHRGEVVGVGCWPPIVDEDTHRAVVALLSDPARRTTTGSRASHLLSGIARCGVCGGSVTSAGRTTHLRRSGERTVRFMYRCREPGCVAKDRTRTDEWVTRYVLRRLSLPDAADLLVDGSRPDGRVLAEQAAAIQVELDELAASAGRGEITARMLAIAAAGLQERLEQVRRLQATTDRAPVLRDLVEAADPRSVWAGLSLERRRSVVSTLVEVRLFPGGGGRGVFRSDLARVTPKV